MSLIFKVGKELLLLNFSISKNPPYKMSEILHLQCLNSKKFVLLIKDLRSIFSSNNIKYSNIVH